VSLCFSKGLGAPVGSALAGTEAAMRQARRHRKALGGGMRQAGVLAAAALYALDHHVDRLADDHARARRFAEEVATCDGLSLVFPRTDTNLVIFQVSEAWGTAESFCAALRAEGVAMLPISRDRVRAVTHLEIDDRDLDAALDAVRRLRPPAC
jgi:threonine aldolase